MDEIAEKYMGRHEVVQQQINEAGLLHIDISDDEDEGDVQRDAPLLHSMSVRGDGVLISLSNFTLCEILELWDIVCTDVTKLLKRGRKYKYSLLDRFFSYWFRWNTGRRTQTSG